MQLDVWCTTAEIGSWLQWTGVAARLVVGLRCFQNCTDQQSQCEKRRYSQCITELLSWQATDNSTPTSKWCTKVCQALRLLPISQNCNGSISKFTPNAMNSTAVSTKIGQSGRQLQIYKPTGNCTASQQRKFATTISLTIPQYTTGLSLSAYNTLFSVHFQRSFQEVSQNSCGTRRLVQKFFNLNDLFYRNHKTWQPVKACTRERLMGLWLRSDCQSS